MEALNVARREGTLGVKRQTRLEVLKAQGRRPLPPRESLVERERGHSSVQEARDPLSVPSWATFGLRSC